MSATSERTYTAYRTGDGVQPVAEVHINPIPSCTNVVGWVQRDQDDRGLWDEVRIGDTCAWRIVVPAGLVCDEGR